MQAFPQGNGGRVLWLCLSWMLFATCISYSQDKLSSKQRLARIQKIAEQSNGKIEVRVIPANETPASSKSIQIDFNSTLERTKLSEIYITALRSFYNSDFENARDDFETIIRHGYGILAAESHYWLAECHVAMGNKDQAIIAFQNSYLLSEKKTDSLMRLGMLYIEQGENELARDCFQRLLTEFTHGHYIEQSRHWLKRLASGE